MPDQEWHERFGDRELIARMLRRLAAVLPHPLRLMEVCGTHTMALFETGLRPLLRERGIELVSGPGCPVCVTAQADLDYAFSVAADPRVSFLTFGDMLRVPGTVASLAGLKAQGADVRVVYSALDAVKLAADQPARRVVFLAVGFETTAPSIAYALEQADQLGLDNFFIFPLNKTIPAPLTWLAGQPELRLDGFLCPGHVSVIIGTRAYAPVARAGQKPCAIAGFEPVDILRAVLNLARQVAEGTAEVANLYERVVRTEGNPAALALIAKFMQPGAAQWRGLGELPESGLTLRPEYERFDARRLYPDFTAPPLNPALSACRCGEVLMGVIDPPQCPLFGAGCTPAEPLGACMVSQEGSCRAYYRYQGATG